MKIDVIDWPAKFRGFNHLRTYRALLQKLLKTVIKVWHCFTFKNGHHAEVGKNQGIRFTALGEFDAEQMPKGAKVYGT